MAKPRKRPKWARRHPKNPSLIWCHGCISYRRLSSFWPEEGRTIGVQSLCKDCTKTRRRAWMRKHRAEQKAQSETQDKRV